MPYRRLYLIAKHVYGKHFYQEFKNAVTASLIHKSLSSSIQAINQTQNFELKIINYVCVELL